uniref:Uncharacterized protein n=1 Tax=Zooxanthella nutricula TaxID=1333877 RepID=A0A7S2Q6R6_9DINO
MAGPLAEIEQGRGWLAEGEAPEAVVEEARANMQAASDGVVRGRWQLVAAEAHLAGCQPAEALQEASGAAAALQQAGDARAEAAALGTLVDAQLASQKWDDAIATAARAAELLRGLEDSKGHASALLKSSRAQLMQMADPYEAARAALAAAQASVDSGDTLGSAKAMHVAAQAQLLFDPEQALHVAKNAASKCDEAGDYREKACVLQTVGAAKAQIATMQRATHATSMSGRGDTSTPHQWPQYEQQRGERSWDVFAHGASEANDAEAALARASAAEKTKLTKTNATFMRKSFKWSDPRHNTDDAWFRQELRYIEPKRQDT